MARIIERMGARPMTPGLGRARGAHRRDARGGRRPGVSHDARSSSLTLPGVMFIVVTLFLALGAINGQNNLLFWLFGFAIGSLVISGIITGNALMSLRLIAHPVGDAEAGRPLRIGYTLVNTSRLLPNFAIEITESTHRVGRGDAVPRLTTRSPGVVVHLPPRSRARSSSRVIPGRRGRLELDRVRVRTSFPFGFFVKTLGFSAPRSIVVYPAPIPIPRARIDEVLPSDESPTRHLARRGSGFEYYGIREYRPGDPLRRVAWKHSARRGDLLVTEYPDPASDALVLELAPPGERVSDESFETALSLIYTLVKRADRSRRLGLVVPWGGVAIPPGVGPAHRRRVGRALALLERDRRPGVRTTTAAPRHARTVTIGYGDDPGSGEHALVATDLIGERGESR